jgi:formyl-CoA transferase
MQSLYENEHLLGRDFFVDVDQPGVGKLTVPGMPSRYGDSHWAMRRPAPRFGEHSEEVFRGELGLTADRFAALHKAGIIQG